MTVTSSKSIPSEFDRTVKDEADAQSSSEGKLATNKYLKQYMEHMKTREMKQTAALKKDLKRVSKLRPF